jgi:hypothetical protein
MKKIISLFKRDYGGNRLVYDEIVEAAEWVAAGGGIATIKYDGTCCKVQGGQLYKRYDRKLTKSAKRKKKRNSDFAPRIEHFKPAPPNWDAAEDAPNKHTGHWPGWVPVGDGPEDQWHREAFMGCYHPDGTYELVGPKVRDNPYQLEKHQLWPHDEAFQLDEQPPRDFDGLREFLARWYIEGIVWHHPDGRMVKIKRKDFGLRWPEK